MSSVPLAPVGSQPTGGLSGKIVYLHAGHGYTADNLGNGAWTTQRGETAGTEIVEDLGNQDQMTFLANYLWNAGATVVPIRPVGHQANEVVLDNDDAEVTFVGSWNNSSSSVFFGDAGDVPYRFASTSVTETAYARYRPNLVAGGAYPVYAWTRAGSDRTEQLYRVHHAGGTTEVTVNHRRVGNGLVYLGTYHFDAGTDGYVDISNRSDEAGKVVIADMIRFGNGVGDIDRGGGVSGQLREDEAGLYWVKWHVDRSQGISDSEYRTSSSDRTATVSLSPRWAEFMNREADGVLSDRLFVSYHSNGGNGTGRGTLALYNGNNNPATATPNQFLLADLLGTEVNDDLVAQNGLFEHNWFNRTTPTLDRSDIEFGEINNLRINNEFDASIVEVAFHDNTEDAQLMRDANVRDAVGRATYQGIVRYFNNVDSGATPVVMLPSKVSNLRALPTATDGTVVLTWDAPQVNSYAGDAPTGYMVYTSTDGRGFDGGTFVAGGATTAALIPGLDVAQGAYYFKVAAVNAGGESLAPDVVAATPYQADQRVLIVNGFDRLDRSLNVRQPYFGQFTDRVRPAFSNSFDYAVQHAEAITAWAPAGLSITTAQNESVINGQTALGDFDAVVWILGEESSADDTFNSTEQSLVANYLAAGGNLFVSGAEIGWDLDHLNNGRSFYNNTLHADYVADDANTYQASGEAGGIFDGISLTWDDGTQVYNAEFADVINPSAGSTRAFSYSTGGGAGIINNNQLVMFGFPFETILDAQDRADIMAAALNYFGLSATTQIAGDYNNSGQVEQGDLDLVLLNWGVDTTVSGPPAGWVNTDDLVGLVDQAELDGVLLNWGNTAEPGFARTELSVVDPAPATPAPVAPPVAALVQAASGEAAPVEVALVEEVLDEAPAAPLAEAAPVQATAVAAATPAAPAPVEVSITETQNTDALLRGEAEVFKPSPALLASAGREDALRSGNRFARALARSRYFTALHATDPDEALTLTPRQEPAQMRFARAPWWRL